VTQARQAATSVVALLLAATACGTADREETADLKDRIHVRGRFGVKPAISIDRPLDIPRTSSWMGTTGKGDRVGAASTVILQLTLVDARTGRTAVSTLDKGQRPLEVKLGNAVFPALNQALVGKPANSRVVVASSAEDAYGDNGAPQLGIKGGDPVVMVADILSTDPATVLDGPTGPTRTAPATAPRLQEEDGLPVGFDVAGLRRPRKLTVVPLRDGTGPVVGNPDRIAADYLGQVWGAEQPFRETFTKEPARFSIGLDGVIRAWDAALIGRKAGSRVMIITPPSLAYGASAQPGVPAGSTLVYVVDVLGVG
jgi:peptidylprolyl isomerase